jgi:hypothetical protein
MGCGKPKSLPFLGTFFFLRRIEEKILLRILLVSEFSFSFSFSKKTKTKTKTPLSSAHWSQYTTPIQTEKVSEFILF